MLEIIRSFVQNTEERTVKIELHCSCLKVGLC